jgi:hypothetical protein
MNVKQILSRVIPITLVAATLTVIPVSTSSAHTFVGTGGTNTAATEGTKNGSLFVAVERATSAVAHTSSVVASGHEVARSSTGLIFKDSSSGTAQTATVVAGTVLSLYAQVSTTTAFSRTGGTLAVSATAVGMTLTADDFSSAMTQALFSAASAAATTATPVAVLWTAPTTAGTYTVTMRTSTAESQAILASGGTSHNLVVTVLASATANHSAVGGSNNVATNGRNNESLYVAVASNSGASAVVGGTAGSTSTAVDISTSALSKGLLSKDSSNGTAQTATVLAGGVLSLYASVSTASAFSATGGSFSSPYGGGAGNTAYFNSTNTYVGVGTATTSTGVAILWTAPTTAGTYTVSLLTGFSANGAVSEVQTAANGLVPPTLSGNILVTVVAASAGGAYAASRSTCSVQMTGTELLYSSSSPRLDTTDIFEDGQAVYLSLDINDTYSANLPEGNFTVTATGSALVNMDTAAATLLAGTTATDIFVSDGSLDAVRIDQATAGAPLTTTVTVSYNGTTVCTKTVSIRGAVAQLTVANIATQANSAASTVNGEQWMYQKTGIMTPGQFTVVATDSAGNVVSTDSTLGSYSAASGTGTQIPAVTVNARSSTSNASSPGAYNFGGFACGADAGQANVAIKFTTTTTGAVVTSDAFVARCAGTASTYVASLDKASYLQGDVAKATVKFLDSKGNKANNMVAIGANSWVLPYMTAVDSTITATTGASATSVTDANGEVVYTFTVGTTTAAVAGTYTGIVSFTAPALGVNSTPTYKLTSGSADTSFTEVLKSVVALIASINKQIQALQKLILKR